MTDDRRPLLARAGLVLLNLLAPGLGLLRLGSWRAALPSLVAPDLVLLALALVLAVIPIPSFSALATLVGLFLLAFLLTFIVPAVLTWRDSRNRSMNHPWWSVGSA